VIIGRKGAYRGIHYSPEPFFVIDTAFYLEPKQELDLRWAYYCLLTYDINGMDSGSAIPSTSREAFYRLPVCVPPLRDQRAIACILGSLDDKIQLNRRMNRTLEEMARAIFKSWFIDFDPVRAKAAVRRQHPKWTDDQVSRAACPKLKPEIARLFPDSFEDSELGEIPKGWAVKTIGDLAEIVGGSTPRTTEAAFWEGGTHAWATPKDLSKLSVPVLLETERQITDEGLAQISSGLLPVGTVLLSSRAPIGYLAVAEVPVAINQGFIAMKPRHGVSDLYLLFWARSAHDEIVSRANGSTFLEISKSSFRPIPLVAPPPEVFAAFERLAKPLFGRLISGERESRTLAALRDALLPKLISGELRIPDAERIAARCA
jgi:type I restriction enzyme S subunit